jgi:hypothetical protein
VAAPTHIHQPAENCTEEQLYAAVSARSHHVGFVDFQTWSVLWLFSIVEVTYQYLQIIQGFEGALSQSCMFNVMCVSLISGFITFLIVIWILQETVLKVVRPLRYTILFMGTLSFPSDLLWQEMDTPWQGFLIRSIRRKGTCVILFANYITLFLN